MCVCVCMSAFSKEHFKRAVCYPGPLCFKDGCLISKVWMLWKKKVSMWGLHLNFLQLKITFLLMRVTPGHEAREVGEGEKSAATKGEVSGGDGFGGRGGPRDGTLQH